MMSQHVDVRKDGEREWPVPSIWRPVLREIAEALKNRNYTLVGINYVSPLDQETAEITAHQIDAYGCTLASLPDDSWETSVCQWLGEDWEVLVDLFTVEEGSSDLVMHLYVYEDGNDFRFDVHLVYVP